ncbi:MAG TPA: NADH-quinone oxidoreductase subunit L [Gaiellaceae bacterium]|nr:NADH-quinone oxidoreductase subunit L [Gaiellaceae bacterium]
MTEITTSWICLFTPLAAVAVIALGGNRFTRRAAGLISTGSVALSFAAAVVAFASMLSRAPHDRSHLSTAWTWLSAGNIHFGLSILVDPLSVFMMLVVSGVGGLIVAYSIGYMHGDDEERRYFAYMALFVFSMLMLVEGGNLLLLLAGWGLVGLSSYLLIGFWHERPSAVAAAKKAFVMNAIGDATFALALFLLIAKTGTLDYSTAFASAHGLSSTVQILIALGLLGGAVAKSAQLPLHTWLPDAMEGPTPVSALIHAATMVTAGVYLIARTAPIFQLAPSVQDTAAALGAVTLVVAGLIALVQTDIKRVIAYSTMSQIGYMFLGVGLGAYASGMFHLLTHAFFKALLFLAAGVVIHALAGEQDIRKMGGLRKLMPKTYLVFLVGALSLAGIPPFSGFFSKDPIIAAAIERGGAFGYVMFALAVAGTLLTGLYTFRLLFRVFHGERNTFVDETYDAHHGEGPLVMLVPVFVLAIGATLAGWLQVPGGWHAVSNWLKPVAAPVLETTNTQEAVASIVSVALALVGAGIAWWIYVARRRPAPAPVEAFERKFWFDELYDAVFYKPAVASAKVLYALIEGPLVGGTVMGISEAVRSLGGETRRLQTGLVRTYVLALAASLAVLFVVFVAVR